MSEQRYRKDVIRQERSLIINARVDVTEMAELAVVFESNGIRVRSASHFIALCIHQMHMTLVEQGMIGEEDRIDSIAQAWDVLRLYHLTTKTMEKRNEKKLMMATAFENLRREGVDPAINAPHIYKQLHNRSSVTPIGKEGETTKFDIKELTKTYHELEMKERNKHDSSEQTVEEYLAEQHGMSVEEYREYVKSDEYKEEKEKAAKERAKRNKKIKSQIERNKALRVQEELEEKARVKAMKKAAKLKAECEALEEEDNKIGKIANSDEPRHLTEEELSEKGKSIEERDIKLATIDMSAPKKKDD